MANRTKREANLIHFGRNLFARYGISATDEVVQEVVDQIQEGRSDPLFTQSHTRTHHAVEINGERVLVVYDKSRGVPVTALPPDAESQYESQDESLD